MPERHSRWSVCTLRRTMQLNANNMKQNLRKEDFSSFLGAVQAPSNKERMLRECEKLGVVPYIDDPSESSSGVYAQLRGVASEAELERRLNAARASKLARLANIIATLALIVSVVALVKSFASDATPNTALQGTLRDKAAQRP